ncbi:sensor histidine kinase [Deinococcus sp. Marseille-Q6407]|uniref:sensor histidine kinase n=1 Tax=Deinococcus sp. Marseille-Q6407 TaxID=2969223 RepID=UPI0021BEC741|nr:HAMP domain-containing sensor histidine kinase [Deinococcus sp. Marseille-Q6407]
MPAPLPTPSNAKVAWHESLRFRLALAFSLVTLVLVTLVGGAMMTLLLRGMDTQFQMRLADRADTLSLRLSSPSEGLGESLGPALDNFSAVLDEGGKVILAPKDSSLPLQIGDQFPYPLDGDLMSGGVPFRGLSRRLTGSFFEGQTLWVALPSESLLDAREAARRALLLAMIVTPLLTLLLGYLLGQRMLSHLGRAAELADQIDPAHSVAALPLPNRQDEVHRLISAINRLLVRIDAQQTREKALLGQIVHELGAPLTVLKATLDRAGERSGDPEIQKAALVTDELTFTTQDLMQLARGDLDMKLVWHLIHAGTLRDRLERLVPGTEYAGDWSGMILCDPDRLTQALRNLLANARRAAGPDGRVTLTLEAVGDQLQFTVNDSGPGLPDDLGESIFDPFVSGSGSSGLGLSVSRQIAALHGGQLTGGNGPAGGAEFRLSIPDALLDSGDDDDDWAEDDEPEATPVSALH